MTHPAFDIDCRRCGRLATFLDDVKVEYPAYHARPVAPFGDPQARLLVVGLAPGMHGANATGRPFTGDHAGILLYETLFKTGFSNQPESQRVDDGLELHNCRITNAVKCLPPQNKPIGSEVKNCNAFLKTELGGLAPGSVVIALGGVAHKAVISALGMRQADFGFGHQAEHVIGPHTLVDSYHCSRYNTQTRRLTEPMFLAVFERARELVNTSGND